jgi:hypothetical protein
MASHQLRRGRTAQEGARGREDGAAHEFGRARNRKQATESWKRTQRKEGRAEGGRAVFIAVRESSTAPVHARSLIGGPLNPGGQTPRLRLLNI